MKAFIQKLRLECLCLKLQGEALDFVESARNIIRRAGITLLQANDVIRKLKTLLRSEVNATNNPDSEVLAVAKDQECEGCLERMASHISNKATASAGQYVRHKETQKSYTKKTFPHSIAELWVSLTTIPSFYPEQPKSEHALLQLLFEFGKMLRIDCALLGRAVSTLGIAETVQIADQIAAKVDEVKSSVGYLAKILANSRQQRVGHGQLQFIP